MTAPNAPGRLLVVDDDPLVCRAVDRLFTPLGYAVETARTAAEAVARFSHGPCPVVITDVGLPDNDGLSLVDDLVDLSPNTTFVVVTAAHKVRMADRHGDKSIVSIIAKPWDDEELFAAVAQARDLHDLRRTRDLAPPRTKLLLVEDNPGDALLIEDLLGLSAFDIEWVTHLKGALEAIRCESHPVVLTDLSLPDARGLDCVTQISRASPHSAVMVLSGSEDDELAAHAFRLGAEDYLVKGTVSAASLCRSIRFATERKRAERRVAQLAHTDALTGLANRAAFTDRVRRACAHARRTRTQVWLLYLDLDKFKAVNDDLGHAAGDSVLRTFADRLVAGVRPYDVVGRIGGDEFAILLEDVSTVEAAEGVVRRILASVAEPMELLGRSYTMGTSIGVGTFPTAGDTPEALIADADAAMYVAKRAGTNLFCVHGRSPRGL